jgi:pyruvyl transferase EpsO
MNPGLARTREELEDVQSNDPASPIVERLMLDLARWRVERGFDILGSGSVLITDRLHGHIMALLLGRPHVILNNSYGKVFDLYRTWTQGIGSAIVAETPSEALRMARRMVVEG